VNIKDEGSCHHECEGREKNWGKGEFGLLGGGWNGTIKCGKRGEHLTLEISNCKDEPRKLSDRRKKKKRRKKST